MVCIRAPEFRGKIRGLAENPPMGSARLFLTLSRLSPMAGAAAPVDTAGDVARATARTLGGRDPPCSKELLPCV